MEVVTGDVFELGLEDWVGIDQTWKVENNDPNESGKCHFLCKDPRSL